MQCNITHCPCEESRHSYASLILQDFPESCLNQYSPCYFGLLVPTFIPVMVVFMYFNWMGLKFFIHN